MEVSNAETRTELECSHKYLDLKLQAATAIFFALVLVGTIFINYSELYDTVLDIIGMIFRSCSIVGFWGVTAYVMGMYLVYELISEEWYIILTL